MEVYGLTGGIGSGKSTVAAMLEEYGVPVVSADELSRMVVAPGSEGLSDVVEAFGREGGFLFILNVGFFNQPNLPSGIVWASEQSDVTEELVRRIDAANP